MEEGKKLRNYVRDVVDFKSSAYDEIESDSNKLLTWFYNSYYGPNKIFPVLKSGKQACILMLGMTFAFAMVLLILRDDWNIFKLLNEVPFLAQNEYYQRVGEGSNFANYCGYLILCEGACALTLNILQLFIIDKSVGKKRFFSREGFCFWLLSLYLAAIFGRLIIPLMKWRIKNWVPLLENSFFSPEGLYAALLVGAFFCSMSSGIKAILAVYISVLVYYACIRLNVEHIMLFPFEQINRILDIEIFRKEAYILILGIELTVITQLILDFIEWLPFWDDFILWIKRKLTTRGVLLVMGLGSLTVALIIEILTK